MHRVNIGPISLAAPADWTLTTVILAGPVDENPPDAGPLMSRAPAPFQQNLVISMEQVGDTETPESYFQRQREALLRAGVATYQRSPAERVKLDSGLDGLLSEQIIQSPKGEWVCQMQVVSIKEGVAYTAIGTHLDGPPYQRVRDTFRQILLSMG